MPSRTPLAALAVASTTVRPMRATTAPWDCWASLPVSKVMVLSVPEIGPDTVMASAMVACLLWFGAATGPVPRWSGQGACPWQPHLAADLPVAARGLVVQEGPLGALSWFVPC